MSGTDYFARQSRPFEVIVGILAGVIGAALLSFGLFCVYRTIGSRPDGAAIVLTGVALGLGLFLFLVGVRLIAGRSRADGGLLSPL